MILLNKKIVFSKAGTDKLFAFKFINDKIDSIEYCDNENIVGNIYVGIVSDLVKNINASFVGFGKGLKGYYLLNDNKPIFLNPKNNQEVCKGDRILVQVCADKVKTKEYSLTSNISLSDKYLVLTVGKIGVNISKKITDVKLRNELKEYFKDFENEEYGFILRTESAYANKDDIYNEARQLVEKWNEIKHKATFLIAGSLVKKNDSEVVRISKEAINKNFTRIITDDEVIYQELCGECMSKDIFSLYDDKSYPLHKVYSLEKILSDSCNKRFWLNSGAYLIIEYTEALTVIDVNTGKADLKGKRDEVFLKINIEAASAIANQLRTRNLSGIIIVDFINMKNQEYNQKILEKMKQFVSDDDVTTTVVGLTNLGLMEITRKRTKKPLHEII